MRLRACMYLDSASQSQSSCAGWQRLGALITAQERGADGFVRVPTAVSVASLQSGRDLRMLDGTDAGAHLSLVLGMLSLPGACHAPHELALGARCAAEVLLQTAPLLLELVRAPRRGAAPASGSWRSGWLLTGVMRSLYQAAPAACAAAQVARRRAAEPANMQNQTMAALAASLASATQLPVSMACS